jgi:asparagine synthase (glutamine-hydrolysing)
MCGLTGGWWADSSFDIEYRIQCSLKKISNRGPDDSGYKLFELNKGALALGHTRLSIIDLSSAGHQPMSSDDGRYYLVFNGELYNYLELKEELISLGLKFNTRSDTEVLLKSWVTWGSDCLIKFDGMFAFVIFDSVDKTLFCARDAFGVKPFFYDLSKDSFVFSSELSSLIELRDKKTRPDLQRAYDYLVHGEYDSNERTFIDGVYQLKPAQYMSMTIGEPHAAQVRTWWSPEKIKTKNISFDDAVKRVRSAFMTNIRRQLRSDVPLGIALSGGVDSSSVVCAVREVAPDVEIHTFSYISEGIDLSEEVWVDRVNSFVAAKAHKVVATSEELISDINDMIAAQGEPFGSTSIYAQYRVFHLARSAGIKVTLDGQGADELLAGYDGYPGQRIKSLFETGRWLDACRFIKAWSKWPNRSVMMSLKLFGQVLLPGSVYDFFRKMLGRDYTPAWLDVDYLINKNVELSENRLRSPVSIKGEGVSDHLKFSLGKRSLPSLLRHADRNSMNFSIESRVPFLSVDFAELLLSLPEEYLISGSGETKSVFRAAMRGIVPDDVLDRRDKVGFTTPEKDWLLGMVPTLVKWLDFSDQIPFINKAILMKEFNKIVQGDQMFSWQVWRWVNYCCWYNMFIDE